MKKGKKISASLIIIIIILIFFLAELVYFLISLNKKEEKNFTIIVLPDTQGYAKYPDIFLNQTKWIADNKEKLNIKFVIHEGDIVKDGDASSSKEQWDVANKSFSILEENNIPYSVTTGNHDGDPPYTYYYYYNLYFPVSRFSGKEWYKGYYKNDTNSIQSLEINGKKFTFISIEWCPPQESIEWAKEVLKNYSDTKIILTTHGFLGSNGRQIVHACDAHITKEIWTNLINTQKNLQLVLCGHEHPRAGGTEEARRTDLNVYGQKVYQILADYQDRENGGNGFLRILEFSQKENKIYVKTYSPYTNEYEKDEDSEFVLDYNLR